MSDQCNRLQSQASKRRKRKPAPRSVKPLPSAESLWDRFSYNPLTGELIWKSPPKQKPFLLGRAAGRKSSEYTWIRLSPEPGPYAAHRLVWCWVTGQDPGELEVDHVNLVKSDNRFFNLRLASQQEQSRNTPKRKTWRGEPTKSSLKGVSIGKRQSGSIIICARIKINGRSVHLGVFDTEELAHAAYCKAAKDCHGEFARVK